MGRTFVYSRQSKRCFWNRFKNIRAMLFTKAERRRMVSFRWADHEEAVDRVEETTLGHEITRAVRMCSVCWLGAGALSSCRHFFPRGGRRGRSMPAGHPRCRVANTRQTRQTWRRRPAATGGRHVCRLLCYYVRGTDRSRNELPIITAWHDVTGATLRSV